MNVNEQGFLWYLQSSSNMVNVLLKYFQSTVEDEDLKNIIKEIYSLSTYQEKEAERFLSEIKYHCKNFFSEEDILNINTRVFSDQLIIEILKHITGNGMRELAIQYSELTDYKVKVFYKDILNKLSEIDLLLFELLQNNGLLQDKSFAFTETEVREDSFLKVASTQKRPLNTVELSHMFSSLQCNNVGLALCTGFSEIVSDTNTKQIIINGKKLAFNQVSVLSDLFKENGVSISTGLESLVYQSNESPLSDRLVTNLIMFLNPIGINNLQSAVTSSYKKEHVKILKELIEDVEDFSKDVFKLLVKKDWLNEPPVAKWSNKK
jgi:spore coat protein CotF